MLVHNLTAKKQGMPKVYSQRWGTNCPEIKALADNKLQGIARCDTCIYRICTRNIICSTCRCNSRHDSQGKLTAPPPIVLFWNSTQATLKLLSFELPNFFAQFRRLGTARVISQVGSTFGSQAHFLTKRVIVVSIFDESTGRKKQMVTITKLGAYFDLDTELNIFLLLAFFHGACKCIYCNLALYT